MTRPLRRDARTKGASVITGLRLEPETAQQLRDKACTDALDEECGRGDVSALARIYIRTGAGLSSAEAYRREQLGRFDKCLAGLKLEPDLCRRLETRAEQLGVTKVGAARHFIRLGLGFSVENSLEREAHFAELAASKYEASKMMGAQFRGTR